MSDAEEEVTVQWAASPSQSVWNDDTFAARYEQDLNDFFNFLVELNIDIYIVEHILAFPVDLFSGGHAEGNIFFSRIIDNFADNSILLITKLVKDDGESARKPVYNLRQFKNKIREALREEHKDSFSRRFQTVDFEKRTDSLLEKAKTIRDHRIAHHTPGIFRANFAQTTQPVRLLFEEIKELRDALNDYYEALTFGAECFMLPSTYQDNKSDVDEVLDGFAKNSAILNMPELSPERWKYQRQYLTDEEIAHLDRYRKKFGLSEIETHM
jgi:hypothetical protein